MPKYCIGELNLCLNFVCWAFQLKDYEKIENLLFNVFNRPRYRTQKQAVYMRCVYRQGYKRALPKGFTMMQMQ